MAIKFKLMVIKIVLNEVEHNTAIYFSLHFSDHLNKTSRPVYRQPIFKFMFSQLFLQAIHFQQVCSELDLQTYFIFLIIKCITNDTCLFVLYIYIFYTSANTPT